MIEKYINKTHVSDCLQFLKNMPDESVDMTFADPPFNLRKEYNSYDDTLDEIKYIDWCEKWIKEMVRITKNTGSIFIHNIPKWLTFYAHILNNMAQFRHWISWSAPTAPMGKTLQPSHYGILFYVKNRKKAKFYEIRHPHKRGRKDKVLLKDYGGKKYLLHPFGPLVSDIWTDIHRIRHRKNRDEHPCQLPVHLLERIVLMATDEGDIVLDPFMGTGTTALAASRLGRNFIGVENDAYYTDISNQKALHNQFFSKLKSSWVSFYLNEIVSLRDRDWHDIQDVYEMPENIKEIDCKKIKLKKEYTFSKKINEKICEKAPYSHIK